LNVIRPSESALFSAPDFAELHLVFDAAPGDPLNFLTYGALWWSGDAAIAQGTVGNTVAVLAQSLPIDTGLRQAVVVFGAARRHSPKALAQALDQTLPVAKAGSEVAPLATVDIAPTGGGWKWDTAVVRIMLTGADGVPTSAMKGDFPLTLRVRVYSMARHSHWSRSV